MADGTRRVVQITEVQAMEGDIIVMQDIFRFIQTGFENGKVQGHFTLPASAPNLWRSWKVAA